MGSPLRRRLLLALPVLALALSLPVAPAATAAPPPYYVYLPAVFRFSGGPTLAGCPMLPADNIWNAPVDTLPLDGNSANYINSIGANTHFHADFGSSDWPSGSGIPIGIPFNIVPGSQATSIVNFDYADESDRGPYPIPASPLIEGVPPGVIDRGIGGDRHILIVNRNTCTLYELYAAYYENGAWYAGSGAVYNLKSNDLRPAGWTSADAAGLPILPGLARYDEVASGEIRHALRFTANTTRRAYVWPARHSASSNTSLNQPPMGQRFRLKASFVIPSTWSPDAQVIARAMKKYGLILADNGSSWYVSGAPDERWDNDVLHQLDAIRGSDFEAVDVSRIQGPDPNSGQVKH